MPGRRLYITVSEHDWNLIRHIAMMEARCPGQWARFQVEAALYRLLMNDHEMQEYEAALYEHERQEVLDGSRFR